MGIHFKDDQQFRTKLTKLIGRYSVNKETGISEEAMANLLIEYMDVLTGIRKPSAPIVPWEKRPVTGEKWEQRRHRNT